MEKTSNDDQQLEFDLRKSKVSTKGKYSSWFVLSLCLIPALFWLGVFWIIHEWAIPTFVIHNLSGTKWLDILKMGKGHSP